MKGAILFFFFLTVGSLLTTTTKVQVFLLKYHECTPETSCSEESYTEIFKAYEGGKKAKGK